MPEHPTDVDKPEDRQRHGLELAVRLVADDRDDQQETDRVDGQRQEQPEPARRAGRRVRVGGGGAGSVRVRAGGGAGQVGGGWWDARAAGERAPAAMQVLRRFSPAQMQRALMGLAALPSLGAGEALPTSVRQPMEIILQRDLSSVRTYTSPVAEAFGAEAFTTGERVVFAPGRMDVRSARSLSLLAHELTHVGQPLAFKQSAGTDANDAGEQRAQSQEAEVERIIKQGWPQAQRMEVRQAASALSALAKGGAQSGASAGQSGGASLQMEQRSLDGGGQAPSGGESGEPAAALPTARLSDAPSAGHAGAQGSAAPDVEKLAREVYDILKVRLRAEKTRHQVY